MLSYYNVYIVTCFQVRFSFRIDIKVYKSVCRKSGVWFCTLFFSFSEETAVNALLYFFFCSVFIQSRSISFFPQNCCRIWLSFADLLRLLYLVYSLVCIYSQICFALLFLFAKEDIYSYSVEFRLQKFLHVFVFNEYICALRFIQIFSEIVVLFCFCYKC